MRPALGEILSRSGALTLDGLRRAADYQKTHGGTIERALLASGALTEEALTVALGNASGLEGVLRDRLMDADYWAVVCLAAESRRRLRAIPFEKRDGVLFVAVADPDNPVLVTGLEAATGSEVRLFAAAGPVLEDLLEHWEKVEAGKAAELARRKVQEDPPPDEAVDKAARLLIADALRGGAHGFEVGLDRKGGYSKTHHFGRPPFARRLQPEVAKAVLSWFRYRLKQADQETSHSFNIQLEDGTRLIVERTESGPEGMRVQFREEVVVESAAPPSASDGNEAVVSAAVASMRSAAPAPAAEAPQPAPPGTQKCTHPMATTDVFCPICGEPVF